MYFNDPWSLSEHGVSLPSIITIFLLYQLLWLADDIIASWWTQGQHPHSQFVNLFLLYNHLRSEKKSPDITWQTLCECFCKPWTVSCLPSHSFSLSLPRLLFEFHLCPCIFMVKFTTHYPRHWFSSANRPVSWSFRYTLNQLSFHFPCHS